LIRFGEIDASAPPIIISYKVRNWSNGRGGNRVLSFQSHMNPIKNWSVRKAHVIETCVAFHNIRGGEFLLKERGKWILRREEWRRSYVNLGSS